jgi:hypothetical protein
VLISTLHALEQVANRAIEQNLKLELSKQKQRHNMSKSVEAKSSGIPYGGTRDVNDFIAPKNSDVLFGRGGGGRYHLGTRAYRYLVKRNQGVYCTCSERKKRLISRSIVLALRKQGRRFLSLSKENAWFEIDIDKAVTKTSQSLREGQPRRRQDLTFKYNAVNQALHQPAPTPGVNTMLAAASQLATKTANPVQALKPPGFPGSSHSHVDRNGAISTVLDRRSMPYTHPMHARIEQSDRQEASTSDASVDVKVGVARTNIKPENEANPALSAMHYYTQDSTRDIKESALTSSSARMHSVSQPSDGGGGRLNSVQYSNQVFGASAESKVNEIGEFIRNSKSLSSDHTALPMHSVADSKFDPTMKLAPDSDSDNEGRGFFGGLNALVAPLNSDVLFGRGGGGQYHPGTQAYRYLVRENQPQYCICTERQKRNIAKNIVESLRDQGRRFLSRNKIGTWYDIGNDEAIKKTSQALREGQPYRRLSIVRTDDSTAPDSAPDTSTAHVQPSFTTSDTIVSSEANRNMSDDNPHMHLPLPAPPHFPSTTTSKTGASLAAKNNDSPVDLGSHENKYGPRKLTDVKESQTERGEDEDIAIQALAVMAMGGVAGGQVSATTDRSSDHTSMQVSDIGKPINSNPVHKNHLQSTTSTQTAIQPYQQLTVAPHETAIVPGSANGRVECIEPRDTDILCYRGACIRNHPGTTEYRDLVRHHQPRYCVCTEREKRNIAILIVVKLRAQNRRFLTKGADGIWFDIGDTKAVKKTSQALREGQAERRLMITKARTAAALPSQFPPTNAAPSGPPLKELAAVMPNEPSPALIGTGRALNPSAAMLTLSKTNPERKDASDVGTSALRMNGNTSHSDDVLTGIDALRRLASPHNQE